MQFLYHHRITLFVCGILYKQNPITSEVNQAALKESINELADEIMLAHLIKIIIDINNLVGTRLTAGLRLNILRVVQEQINNGYKHAQGSRVTIRVQVGNCYCCTTYLNDKLLHALAWTY